MGYWVVPSFSLALRQGQVQSFLNADLDVDVGSVLRHHSEYSVDAVIDSGDRYDWLHSMPLARSPRTADIPKLWKNPKSQHTLALDA